MDSYALHFERMSNVDLHPLSLPVSRLSPAKSNSSIVDQLAHHQHGKGDSAYSSFSGGSTAPDYPSPFLPDELQSSSFSQYADLKYVKSIYHPTHVLHSDSKTMDQLYRSVKAISQQYRNNAGIKVNHNNHNANDAFYSNNLKQEVSLTKGAYHNPIRPPPIPTRLDSYIATKNLENSRIHQHSTEIQQAQQQPRSNNRLHSQERDVNVSRPEMVLSNKSSLNLSSDPVYSVWRGSQQQQQGAQQSPSCQPPDQTRTTSNPEHLFITDNNSVHDQQKSTNVLNRSPPRSTIRQEQRRPSTNGDHHKKPNAGTSQFERQRKRAYSANEWLGSETTWAPSPWKSGQSVFNSSIQHKGQFYFVTGVCKGSGSGTRSHSTSSCVSEAGSNISTVPETYQLREKERCHSTLDNLFGPLQQTSRSSSGTVPDECETFTSLSQGNDMTLCSQDQENCRLISNSVQSSQSFDTSEEIDMQTRDSGRHTACNPIFYCGPDRTSPPHSSMETQELPALISPEQTYDQKKLNQVKKGTRQPLGDVASERINKETTPLLYHLTGASRAPLQPNISLKSKEPTLHKTIHGNLSDNERPIKSDTSKNDGGEISACNTLDDSFKKYYKEKLKDAQSKVLRETSFKRRDLQLSWPHRVRQKPRAIHSFSSSQDSETSTDTLTPSLISEETETGNIEEDWRENWMEMDKETEKQNVSPVYVAQSQISRIGGKKRLTPEQKKMCYSEPEKLNQLGGTPVHSSCRSFGNESESLFSVECEEDEGLQQGEQGLVAARCKMFESRGQAFSATGASKTNLKHLQHKALVEYMERKTGQKVAEPQQPWTQVPPPSRQRHSLGEKPFDWGHRQLSGNNDGKNTKKKLQRPHSAGRILDSPSSSVRYAQFFSAQSCSGQYALQANQPGRRESKGRSQGKCASVESLLDQPEPLSFLRNRSASTPQTLEDLKACDSEKNSLPVKSTETTSLQKKPAKNSLAAAAEGQQRFRVVAQRGKSMEELAASKLTRLSALSRSSEQLDQFRRSSTGPGGQDREKYVSFFDEIREAHGEDRDRKREYLRKHSAKELDQKPTLGQTQNQNEKKSLLKQHSESGEDPIVGTRNSSRPTSPTSTSSRTRVHSRSHGSDMLTSTQPPSETLSTPPSPSNLETSEKELKSASSSPTQTKNTCEMGPCSSRDRTSSVAGLEREQSVNEPVSEPLLPDSNHEVSLGSGVTTDPALWILPPEEEIREEVQTSPLVDDVFDDESTTMTAAALTRRPSVSPCASVSSKDQQGEDENIPETEGERSTENLEMEERGTPEDQTASVQKSSERPQWEQLVEAVVAADPSLTRTLYPLANRKTALMLMEQLLSEDTLLMEEHYKKKEGLKEATESTEMVKVTEPCTYPSAPESPKPQCSDLESKTDITEKKCLLVSHIEGRLRVLEEMRSPLQAEIEQNAAHGEALALLVREHCLPVELERYNLFIGDLERVVNLLLCLSARLARVQNALSTVDHHTDAEEKQSLDSRHRLLCKQREDAKDLKDNLDRRENMVSTFLSRQLSAEQLQDYRHFVQTKASLLIRQKDLEEKQRLGEEQLEALSNSPNL